MSQENPLKGLRHITTPVVAKYCSITAPVIFDQAKNRPVEDWKDGKYSVTLRITREEADNIAEKVEKGFAEYVKAQKKANPKYKNFQTRDLFEDETDDDGESTGYVLLRATKNGSYTDKESGKVRRNKLQIVDSQQRVIKPESVYGGSVLKAMFGFKPWVMPSNKQFGLKFDLYAVQIVELKAAGSTDVSAFGTVEGGYTEDDDDFAHSTKDEDDYETSGEGEGDAGSTEEDQEDDTGSSSGKSSVDF